MISPFVWVWLCVVVCLLSSVKCTTKKPDTKLKILFFSTMNEEYQKEYAMFHNATTHYVKKYGYEYVYEPNAFEKLVKSYNFRHSGPPPPHYHRIIAAKALMENKIPGYENKYFDWIVYIDSDAFIAENNLPVEALFRVMELEFLSQFDEKVRSIPCDFIAQDGFAINSGFWFIRNNAWGKEFLKKWWDICDGVSNHKFMKWIWDQGPLQDAILYEAARQSNTPYTGHCWSSPTDGKANECYHHTLVTKGFAYGHRKIGPICLLPQNQGVPLLFHTHYNYAYGEYVLHDKVTNKAIVHEYPHLVQHFDLSTNHVTFAPNFVIELPPLYFRPWRHETFQFSNAHAHLFPNLFFLGPNNTASRIVVQSLSLPRLPTTGNSSNHPDTYAKDEVDKYVAAVVSHFKLTSAKGITPFGPTYTNSLHLSNDPYVI